MSRRKEGLSPQERLARLAGAARPISEQVQPDQVGNATASDFPSSYVTEIVTPPVMSPVTSHVSVDDSQHATEHVTAHVSSNGTKNVTDDVTDNITEDTTSIVSKHVTSHVTQLDEYHVPYQNASHDAKLHPSPDTDHDTAQNQREAQLTARVRGRWTPEQLAFIKHLAKNQRATAGEVLRHIVAWYLEEGVHLCPTAKRANVPSPQGLVKRETGLRILDFMTTEQQSQAIKAAAVRHGGEAVLLREAVDAYRKHGPLVRGNVTSG